MKHLKFIFVLTLLASVAFVSCKKDPVEEEIIPTKANQFTYNNVNYDLTKSYIHAFGVENSDPVSYGYELIFTNSTILWDSTSDFTGTGNAVAIDLYTNDPTGIPSGTYTFDEMSGNALTFDDGLLLINFNLDEQTGSYYNIDGGSLTVVRTGAVYEFTFTGSASDYQGNSNGLNVYMKSTLMFLMGDAKSKIFGR